MKAKVHKRFRTALGFPVTYCTTNRNSLQGHFKDWQKKAKMSDVPSEVTCKHCRRELNYDSA